MCFNPENGQPPSGTILQNHGSVTHWVRSKDKPSLLIEADLLTFRHGFFLTCHFRRWHVLVVGTKIPIMDGDHIAE